MATGGNELDKAGVERAVLLGASWGGPIGVIAGLRSPERFRGLILMNAPMHGFTRWQKMQRWALLLLYQLLGPRDFLIRSVTYPQLSDETRRAHPDREAAFAACFRALDRKGMTLAMRSVFSSFPSLFSRLAEVAYPRSSSPAIAIRSCHPHKPVLLVDGDDRPLRPRNNSG